MRVGIHEAKTHLSRLVERARAGEEVVIQRSGEPVAKLVPIRGRAPVAASYGVWRGQIEIAEDFDELPDDIAAAFGASANTS